MTKCSAHPVHIDLQQKSLIPKSSCILTRVHIWCFPFTFAFIFWLSYLLFFFSALKLSALIQFCFDLPKSSSVDCLCQTIACLAYAGFLLLLVLLIFPLYLISILPFFSAKPLLCLTSPLRFVLYCTLSFFPHSFWTRASGMQRTYSEDGATENKWNKNPFPRFGCVFRMLLSSFRAFTRLNIESMGTFKKNFITVFHLRPICWWYKRKGDFCCSPFMYFELLSTFARYPYICVVSQYHITTITHYNPSNLLARARLV